MNDNFQNGSDDNNNQYTNQPNQNQQYDPNQQQNQQQNQQYNPNQQQYNNQQYDPNQQQYNPNQQQYNPNTQYNINVNVPPPGYAPKSKIAAGILGIFLGSIGVHNFYLGYTGKAIAQLLIAVLTCGIGAAVTSIWGLIEGILILTGSINVDGKGIPLAD